MRAASGGGNLRDRFLFALLAESGMRIGEALGLRIRDFVMGRGGTPYVEVVPREGNANGARVKMMRARRIYLGTDLERLFADYLTHLALRAAELGLPLGVEDMLFVTHLALRAAELGPLGVEDMLFVNLHRAALREGTVRDKIEALRRRGIGPRRPALCPRPARVRRRGHQQCGAGRL